MKPETILEASFAATAGTLLLGICGAYLLARFRSRALWNVSLLLMLAPAAAYLFAGANWKTVEALDVCAIGGQALAIHLLRGAVNRIPHELFDAGEMNGAGHIRQMWAVVLPFCGFMLAVIGVMYFACLWSELSLFSH